MSETATEDDTDPPDDVKVCEKLQTQHTLSLCCNENDLAHS